MNDEITPAHFYFEQLMEQVDELPLAEGRAAVYSDVSPGKSTPNEDTAVLIPLGPTRAVMAVADGLGGERAGEQASRLAVEYLQAALKDAHDADDLRPFILDAFDAANQAVMNLNVGACTTMSVVEINGRMARPYHVGDSMILLVSQRGNLKHQTVCHSPVGFALEAGLIDELEAMVHEERHLVSNVIGHEDMRIEVGSLLKMSPRDTLLIASDGLFDNLLVDEIVNLARKGKLGKAARNIASQARERMVNQFSGMPSKPDDMTFILYRPRA